MLPPATPAGPTTPPRLPVKDDQDTSEPRGDKSPSARLGVPTSDVSLSRERRCLATDDVEYLLEKMGEDPAYPLETKDLKVALSRPDGLSLKEFAALLQRKVKDGDSSFNRLLADMGTRFKNEFWPKGFTPGPSTLLLNDLVNLPRLAEKLLQLERPVDAWLKALLWSEAENALLEYERLGSDADLPKTAQTALLLSLNTIIHGPSIWDDQRFANIALRPETQQVHSQNPQGEHLQRFNRLLLEDAYPQELRRGHKLEDSLSVRKGGADA